MRGIDTFTVQIALVLARENLPAATLVHADVISVSFPPNSFDVVVAVYSLLHLKKEEQELILSRIVTWLKPGGWLACNFPAMTFTDSTHGGAVNEWLGAKMCWHLLGTDGKRGLFRDHARD